MKKKPESRKATDKLEDLCTNNQRLSETFKSFRNRFQNSVITNGSGFPTWFLANQNIQKPWKPANKLIKSIYKKNF